VAFRKRIDGFARLAKERLRADPLSGGVFVFRSRTGRSLRLLAYDGTGYLSLKVEVFYLVKQAGNYVTQ